MMTFLQAWADSLTLLKPKNFQLFVLVTLKSVIEACKLLFIYFWWLPLAIQLCYSPLFFGSRSITLSLWLFQLLLFVLCTITRPSIVKKDGAYFRSQLPSFFYFALLLLFLPRTWITPFSGLMILSILFFLDSEKGPKNFFIALWHALKMIVFNFPLMFCVSLVMLLCENIVFWISNKLIFGGALQTLLVSEYQTWFTWFLLGIFMIAVLPIVVCTYANIYIKKLHDQFDLYFKKPQ